MSPLALTIGCLCALVLTALATSNWNHEMRDYILDLHNEKRRGAGGCQMNKLVYDLELERQARQWAEGCVFGYELKEGRGENLACDSRQIPEKELILGSSGRWFDENITYSDSQYGCGSSCHYTQMVWDSTSKVGCYSHRCPNLFKVIRNAWYLVCFYTPTGNWNGERPYEKTCKTKCREGQTEERGLCVGEGRGEAVNAGGDDGGCDDDQGNCATWAENGYCQSKTNYMWKYCRMSCKVCKSGTLYAQNGLN